MNMMGLSSKAKVLRVVALNEDTSGHQVDLVHAGPMQMSNGGVHDIRVSMTSAGL